jgi:hypothetical protein
VIAFSTAIIAPIAGERALNSWLLLFKLVLIKQLLTVPEEFIDLANLI